MTGKGGSPTGIHRCVPASLKSINLPSVALWTLILSLELGMSRILVVSSDLVKAYFEFEQSFM